MPIELTTEAEDRPVEDGIGICLSGGGYRAMLFHLGAVWRLYEAGILADAKRISSVSGGSITAGQLALAWNQLSFEPGKIAEDFVPAVVEPIRALAGTTIDGWAIGGGILLPGSISDYIIGSYRKHLYGDKTLQDFPDYPRFVINATSLQSGALCRFSKPYMRDYRIGEIKHPKLSVATAVAASSAFPPVLSPCTIDVNPDDFTPGSGQDLQHGSYIEELVLTDGGVYDNLGLETVWKRYKTVFVSDGGGKMQADEDPEHDWVRQSKRVLDVIDNQVRSLRKRQLIDSMKGGTRQGTYWGIRTNIADYRLPASGENAALPAPIANSTDLAEVPTRLKRMPDLLQERLINWGYAVSDAALRKHYDSTLDRGKLPYQKSNI